MTLPHAPTLRSRSLRALRFTRSLARWGIPARSLLFGPLSLGDDLLCTAVLREARRRGAPFAMMTARPELFLGNTDPARILPIDHDYVAGLRRLGARVVQPYYVGAAPADPEREILPSRHIIAEMCARSGIAGEVSIRPYLHLTDAERQAGRRFPRQVAIHSSGLAAAIPYTTKEWGAERFAAVAKELGADVSLIQLGSAQDPALPGTLDLRGRTTLRAAAAILAASDLFIGLEGFLAHLARAVECPAVVVLGGRAPLGIFSYPENRNLGGSPACSPCGLRSGCPHTLACLTQVSPGDVLFAARDLLHHPPTRPLRHAMATIP